MRIVEDPNRRFCHQVFMTYDEVASAISRALGYQVALLQPQFQMTHYGACQPSSEHTPALVHGGSTEIVRLDLPDYIAYPDVLQPLIYSHEQRIAAT